MGEEDNIRYPLDILKKGGYLKTEDEEEQNGVSKKNLEELIKRNTDLLKIYKQSGGQ